MIKLDAIKWLIEHVTKWPTYEYGIVTAPDGWRWCKLMVGMELVKDEPTEMYADMHIVQQEWLDGTDDTETIDIDEQPPEVMRDNVFTWLYETFNVSPRNWPMPEKITQCDSPNGWSWCIGNQGIVVLRSMFGQDQICYADVDKWVRDNVPSSPTDGATKFDDDKPMMHLVPLISVEAVAKVMTFGAKKYAPNGWKSVPNAVDRYNSAMLRHMVAIQKGETIDPDSGLPHIDHIACNAMFLSYFHNVGESNE